MNPELNVLLSVYFQLGWWSDIPVRPEQICFDRIADIAGKRLNPIAASNQGACSLLHKPDCGTFQ